MHKKVRRDKKTDSLAAIAIESMVGGGVERMCIEILKCLIHANYRVDLVLLNYKGELLEQIPNGVNLFSIKARSSYPNESGEKITRQTNINWILSESKSVIEYSNFFRHILPNWPFSIRRIPHRRDRLVHYANGFASYLNQNNPNFVFAMKCRVTLSTLIGREISGNRTPIICSIRNSLMSTTRHRLDIYKKLLHKADWVHTVSDGIKKELNDRDLFPAHRTTAIYNFYDNSRIRSLVGQPSGHPWFDLKEQYKHKLILSVGRLENQKNLSLLIRSFSQLVTSQDIKLVILGEGALRHSLRFLVNELGLNSKVSMPGWSSNPYAFMTRADVFALSSKWEGCCNVLIEALACGCKVVSTDCPTSPREILGEGCFGTLVPLNEELAMSNAISHALESEVDRQSLVNRALDFSPERFFVQFEQMIKKVTTA